MKDSTQVGLFITGLSSAVLTGLCYAVSVLDEVHSEQGAALCGLVAIAGIFWGVSLLVKGDASDNKGDKQ